MSSGGVMLSGWLRKSPPENKLKSRHHSWKKRWFVLKSGRLSGDPNVLEYSKYQRSKRPIKIIDLNDCKKIDANVNIPVRGDKKDKDANQHFIFSIVTSGRTFYLVADSKREMSTWVQCLCDLCGFNSDSGNEKVELGDEKTTFTSCANAPVVVYSPGGSASTPTIGTTESESSSLVRPEMESPYDVPRSKEQNGTVNTSFMLSATNGYDSIDQDIVTSRRDHSNGGNAPYFNNIGPSPIIVMDPVTSIGNPDEMDYLHLTDCETAPGTLQMIEKSDTRRCSTDSVFTHEDTKSIPVQHTLNPAVSRFSGKARLDSMPNVPPPAPPIAHSLISAEALANNMDFDNDDVVDAKRTPRSVHVRPPWAKEESVYNVPSSIPRQPMMHDNQSMWQGRSTSSYGSGKHMLQTEYMNTSAAHFSSSMSTTSDPLDSPFSGTGLHSASSAASGRLLCDHSNPMSPVFLITHPSKPYDTSSYRNTDNSAVDCNIERKVFERLEDNNMPPARPPKPTEFSPRDIAEPVSPKHTAIISSVSNGNQKEPQSLLLPNKSPTSTSSPLSTPNMGKWSVSSKSPRIQSHVTSPDESGQSSIYDVPKSLKTLPIAKAANELDSTQRMPDIDDIANPGYEPMNSGGYMNTEDAVPCDDIGLYTTMAGALPVVQGYAWTSSSPTTHGILTNSPCNHDSPPPVHRDLKPGRISLGSDGGSSQSGTDVRKNSARDSCTSDEGLSPPHTTILQISQFGDKTILNIANTPQIQTSHVTLSPWSSPATAPGSVPQRLPRNGLPQSPLVSPNTNHQIGRPGYSPGHMSARNINSSKPSSPGLSPAPERPPKPASMKCPTMAADNRIPPRRPPKPAEGIHNHRAMTPIKPSAFVPPALLSEMDRELKYIEISTQKPPHSRGNEVLLVPPPPNVDKDLVEYTHIDAGKTQALEKMRKERQGQLQHKINPD